MSTKSYAAPLALLALLHTMTAHAQLYPVWELGVGVGVASTPQYVGSDQRSNWLLPLPYFVYRGENIRIDREAITDRLLRVNQWQLDLSFSVAPPVRSDDNQARQGMPDLDPVFETGISAKRRLWISEDHDRNLRLILPLRAVGATNFQHFQYAGLVTEPSLFYSFGMSVPHGLHYSLVLAPRFASTRNDAYYYAVNQAYATPERPQYSTHGGYGGTHMTLGASQRRGRWWAGGFIRYDNLHGATFEDSPLVKQKDGYWLGMVISYVFKQSEAQVESPD